MPPPSHELQQAWAWAAGQSKELDRRWGSKLDLSSRGFLGSPIDEQGNLNRQALTDLKEITSGRPLPFQLGPTDILEGTPALTREELGRPIDWRKHAADVGAGLQQASKAIPLAPAAALGPLSFPFTLPAGLAGMYGESQLKKFIPFLERADEPIRSRQEAARLAGQPEAFAKFAPIIEAYDVYQKRVADPFVGFITSDPLPFQKDKGLATQEQKRLYEEQRSLGEGPLSAGELARAQAARSRREEPYTGGLPRSIPLVRQIAEEMIFDPINVALSAGPLKQLGKVGLTTLKHGLIKGMPYYAGKGKPIADIWRKATAKAPTGLNPRHAKQQMDIENAYREMGMDPEIIINPQTGQKGSVIWNELSDEAHAERIASILNYRAGELVQPTTKQLAGGRLALPEPPSRTIPMPQQAGRGIVPATDTSRLSVTGESIELPEAGANIRKNLSLAQRIRDMNEDDLINTLPAMTKYPKDYEGVKDYEDIIARQQIDDIDITGDTIIGGELKIRPSDLLKRFMDDLEREASKKFNKTLQELDTSEVNELIEKNKLGLMSPQQDYLPSLYPKIRGDLHAKKFWSKAKLRRYYEMQMLLESAENNPEAFLTNKLPRGVSTEIRMLWMDAKDPVSAELYRLDQQLPEGVYLAEEGYWKGQHVKSFEGREYPVNITPYGASPIRSRFNLNIKDEQGNVPELPRVSNSTRTAEQLSQMSDEELSIEAMTTRKTYVAGVDEELVNRDLPKIFEGLVLSTEAGNRRIIYPESPGQDPTLYEASPYIRNPRIFRTQEEIDDFLADFIPPMYGNDPAIATEYLVSEGFDSVYIPESEFVEGRIIWFGTPGQANIQPSRAQLLTQDLIRQEIELSRRAINEPIDFEALAKRSDLAEPETVGREHTIEELLEAGEYKLPQTARETERQIRPRTLKQIEQNIDLEISEQKILRRVEGKARDHFDDIGELSSREVEYLEDLIPDKIVYPHAYTTAEDIMTLSDIQAAVRKEMGMVESHIQSLRRELIEKTDLDSEARLAAMELGLERIGSHEAPEIAARAADEVAPTTYSRPSYFDEPAEGVDPNWDKNKDKFFDYNGYRAALEYKIGVWGPKVRAAGDEIDLSLKAAVEGNNPFRLDRRERYMFKSGDHALAEMEAMEAGWVPGDTSAKNMDIANRLADQADQGTYVHPDFEAKQAEVKARIEADARARAADEGPQIGQSITEQFSEGLNARSQFEGGEVTPRLGYAWRSMGPKEYEDIIAGKPFGGSPAKRGKYWSWFPSYSSNLTGTPKRTKYLVEVEIQAGGGEALSRIGDLSDVRAVWKSERKGVWTPEPFPRKVEEAPITTAQAADEGLTKGGRISRIPPEIEGELIPPPIERPLDIYDESRAHLLKRTKILIEKAKARRNDLGGLPRVGYMENPLAMLPPARSEAGLQKYEEILPQSADEVTEPIDMDSSGDNRFINFAKNIYNGSQKLLLPSRGKGTYNPPDKGRLTEEKEAFLKDTYRNTRTFVSHIPESKNGLPILTISNSVGKEIHFRMAGHPLEPSIRKADRVVAKEMKLDDGETPVRDIVSSIFEIIHSDIHTQRALHEIREQLLIQATRYIFKDEGGNTAGNRLKMLEYFNHFGNESRRGITFVENLLDDFPVGSEAEKVLINHYYIPDPDNPFQLIIRLERSNGPGLAGYQGFENDLKINSYLNKILHMPGPIDLENLELLSPWVRDKRPQLTEQHMLEPVGRLIQEMGIGYDTDIFQSANVKLDAIIRQHAIFIKDIMEEGSKGLLDSGVGRKITLSKQPLRITDEDWGEWTPNVKKPGKMMKLIFALHYKDGGKWLVDIKQNHPELVEHYHNLRAMANWEDYVTRMSGEIVTGVGGRPIRTQESQRTPYGFEMDFTKKELSDINGVNFSEEDYFNRGFRIADWARDEGIDPFKNITEDLRKANLDLGKEAPYLFGRKKFLIEEMFEKGVWPISFNPYEVVAYRSMMGLRYRMQAHLINIMKRPDNDIAVLVENAIEEASLRARGYKDLSNLEAFKGHRIVATDSEGNISGSYIGRWFVEDKTARILEDMFGPPLWRAMSKKRKLGPFSFKYDDAFFTTKLATLMTSFFQHGDMLTRLLQFRSWSAATSRLLIGANQAAIGTKYLAMWKPREAKILYQRALNNIAQAPIHIGMGYTKGLMGFVDSFVAPTAKKDLKKITMDPSPWYPDHPNPEFRKFSWKFFSESGLGITDTTAFNMDNANAIIDGVEDLVRKDPAFKEKLGLVLRSLASFKRYLTEGLFEGVYPFSAFYDLQYNFVPVLMEKYPDMNADQLALLASKHVNTSFSLLPKVQSVIRDHLKISFGKKDASGERSWTINFNLRQWLLRVLFSIADNEAIIRTFTGMFHGKHKALWRDHWLGGMFATAVGAELIHLWGTGEHLPVDRLNPFTTRDHKWWNLRYNTAFFSPDTPFRTPGGERASVDLLQQQDAWLRLWDMGYKGQSLPGWEWLQSRLSIPMRVPQLLISGKDFWGRDIGEWGHVQKAFHILSTSALPFTVTNTGIIALESAYGDNPVPEWKNFVKEGATVSDVLPNIESRLGKQAGYWQAISGGLINLRAKTTPQLLDIATRNANNDISDKLWEHDLPKFDYYWQVAGKKREGERINVHPLKDLIHPIIVNSWENQKIMEEINRRGDLAYVSGTQDELGDMFSQMNAAYNKRNAKQVELYDRHVAPTTLKVYNSEVIWDPRVYREMHRDINSETRAVVDNITQGKMHDPSVKKWSEEKRRMPDELSEPVEFVKWQYLEFIRQSLVAGKLDYNKFNDLWDPFEAKYKNSDYDPMREDDGVLERFYIWRYETKTQHEFSDDMYKHIRTLEDSGYWKDYFPGKIKDIQSRTIYKGKDIDVGQIWKEYLHANSSTRMVMRRDFIKKPIIKELEDHRKRHRIDIRQKSKVIDEIAIMWYKSKPARMDNVELYQSLYKQPGLPLSK